MNIAEIDDIIRPALKAAAEEWKAKGLLEPIQIVVVGDDGQEVDLCDISEPLDLLLAKAERL